MSELEKALLDHWHNLPRESEESVPRRAALRPRDVLHLLPYMTIHKRLAKNVVIVRLTGTKIDEIFGRNYTGANVYDLYDQEFHPWLDRMFETTLETPCGMRSSSRATIDDGAQFEVDSLRLPFNDEKGKTSILVGLLFVESAFFTARAPRTASVQVHVKNAEFVDLGFGAPAFEDGVQTARGLRRRFADLAGPLAVDPTAE